LTRLYVLVEGQTEQEFVKAVLAPHLQERSVFVETLIVETSRDAFGRKRRGGGKWKHWLRDLKRLTSEQRGPDVRFTTMFDLYGLPDDFPELGQHSAEKDTARRADLLAEAMARAVDDHRLIPHLQRHEFEALVLAGLDVLASLLEDASDLSGVEALQVLVRHSPPEDVNDGKATAPSKRLELHVPSYRKTLHGPLVVEGTGLPTLRKACPRFDAWVTKLEGLAGLQPRSRRG
jgi:uncharacterized protein DUF4276